MPRSFALCVNFAGERPGRSRLVQTDEPGYQRGYPPWMRCCLAEDWNGVGSWNGWFRWKEAEPWSWPCRGYDRPWGGSRSGRSSMGRGNSILPPPKVGVSPWKRCSGFVLGRWRMRRGPLSSHFVVRRWESPGFSLNGFPIGYCNVGRLPRKSAGGLASCFDRH